MRKIRTVPRASSVTRREVAAVMKAIVMSRDADGKLIKPVRKSALSDK